MAPEEGGKGSGSVDDQFRALLEGLRVTLPGVQVLFGFLLTLPLQSAFGQLSLANRVAYAVAFFASAVASVLLIAPSVHQRVRAPETGMRRRSPRHLAIAVWLTIAGTIAFMIALVAAVFLVADLLLDNVKAAGIAAGLALLATWSWFYLPLVHFQRVK